MKRVDIRLKAILITLGLMITIVLVVNFWPNTGTQSVPVAENLTQGSEASLLFDRAVIDLRKRRYKQAIESFRKVLGQTPNMPEAYVNIGFAHLELKQYSLAKQAFHTALELRSGQINAYWGLAVSLEGLCDIPAAMGAMKTYVHLAKKDDVYLKKANAAIWEWQQMKTMADKKGDAKIVCEQGA